MDGDYFNMFLRYGAFGWTVPLILNERKIAVFSTKKQKNKYASVFGGKDCKVKCEAGKCLIIFMISHSKIY